VRCILRAPREGRQTGSQTVTASGSLYYTGSSTQVSAASEVAGFENAIKGDRAQQGLPALTPNAELNAIAQSGAEHMAATTTMEHNPNLTSEARLDGHRGRERGRWR
jgi:uncharacterized protein YkwD